MAPFWERYLDLAQPRLGSRVVFATDDFFAPKERLIGPAAPVFIAGKYDDHGKWMDGWESRRRRDSGHDYCVVALGHRSRVRGVDIDTTHFDGNHPVAASIEIADLAAGSDVGDWESVAWQEVLPRASLGGNQHHFLELDVAAAATHVRLHIYPDGGVARLRLYGEVVCDWSTKSGDETCDLVAVENGGQVLACNDRHFGSPHNLLMPGRGRDMGDGWETRRRRRPGHDWVVLRLGRRGVIAEVEIDTAHFKGNYPDHCSLQATAAAEGVSELELVHESPTWPQLLAERKLGPDQVHRYHAELSTLGPIDHVRVNIFPDGGLSRVRLLGRVAV